MKVLITNRIPEEIIKKYEENFEVDYHDSLDFLSKEELKTRIKDVEGLVCPLSEKIDSEIIDAAKNLKIIANYGAGFDNVDINYAKEKGIIVTNAPASASTKSTAELLENSDVITLHTAYSEKLHHLIDAKAFSKMKKSAYLINASRGKVISEQDLINALNNGEIAGCALDVYEFEPKISEDLRNAKNILLAPHLGNATKLARVQMGEFTFDNIMQFKKGEIPKNKVN